MSHHKAHCLCQPASKAQLQPSVMQCACLHLPETPCCVEQQQQQGRNTVMGRCRQSKAEGGQYCMVLQLKV